MKITILLLSFLTVAAFAKTAERKPAQIIATWARAKAELRMLEKKFRDPKLSELQKVRLLPHMNEVLSEIQELKLTKAEKAEQIRAVIQFIPSSMKADFANSSYDTLYYDFKANRAAYLNEIERLPSASEKKEMKEAFFSLEESEKAQLEEAGGSSQNESP
jgi:hypothetical protein